MFSIIWVERGQDFFDRAYEKRVTLRIQQARDTTVYNLRGVANLYAITETATPRNHSGLSTAHKLVGKFRIS